MKPNKILSCVSTKFSHRSFVDLIYLWWLILPFVAINLPGDRTQEVQRFWSTVVLFPLQQKVQINQVVLWTFQASSCSVDAWAPALSLADIVFNMHTTTFLIKNSTTLNHGFFFMFYSSFRNLEVAFSCNGCIVGPHDM